MSLLPPRSTRLTFAIAIAAYVSGTAVAAVIAAQAVHSVGVAVLGQLAPADVSQAAAPMVRHAAAMTPLNDRSAGPMRPGATRLAAGPQFGTSSRNVSGPSSRFGGRAWGDDDDEDERPAVHGTYRTLCVRMCDGYYFPVSFAVTQDRLEHDSQICASRCGGQARLFIHANPGGTVEDMEDLAGRPYRQLRIAFLYRTEYVPSCTCQPHPWEAAARDRHRTYALAAAMRKGSRNTAKELQALQAKVRQAAKAPDRNRDVITPPAPTEVTRSTAAAAAVRAKQADLPAREEGSLMRLGGNGAPKGTTEGRPERAPPMPRRDRDPEWMKRAFESGHGG